MPRNKNCRWISENPQIRYFKPQGIPMAGLKEVILELDELEAVRWADLEGLYHDQAAEKMKISRQTFGRIITSARGKIAKALIGGMALRIEGGNVQLNI